MSSKSTDKETKSVAEAADVKEVKAVKADAKPEADTAVKKETKTVGKKADKDEAKAAKKPAAKRSTAKKEKAEKPELKPEVFIEYQDQQTSELSVVDKVKAAFVASGHRASSIKSLQIYIKPEEFKAYYVINDNKYNGEVDLF
ncbi:MAG: hypothetical protein K2N87_17950 [Eubacterium sp.]|nr:hypothetical protein [Eubacterium sp.]